MIENKLQIYEVWGKKKKVCFLIISSLRIGLRAYMP